MTFVFGITSVSFFNSEYEIWTEIQVDVPQVKSEAPIICDIYPTKRFPMQYGGGSGNGGRNYMVATKARYPRKQVKSHRKR